jgi:hypothetical protein
VRALSEIQDFGSFVRTGKETQVFAREPSIERKKQRGAETWVCKRATGWLVQNRHTW